MKVLVPDTIYMFGKEGDVRVARYSKEEQMDIVNRWRECDSVRGVISNIHSFFMMQLLI